MFANAQENIFYVKVFMLSQRCDGRKFCKYLIKALLRYIIKIRILNVTFSKHKARVFMASFFKDTEIHSNEKTLKSTAAYFRRMHWR